MNLKFEIFTGISTAQKLGAVKNVLLTQKNISYDDNFIFQNWPLIPIFYGTV